jgi:hypothetical protein
VGRAKSHQSKYQQEAIATGLCSQCFVRPLLTRWRCAECTAKNREAARLKKNCKPWQPGCRGRPPKGTQK